MNIILSVLLLFVACYSTWVFFRFYEDRVNIPMLLVASIGFYYGVGTLMGLVIAPKVLLDEMLVDASLTESDLFWPLVLILAYSLFAYWVGRASLALSFSRARLIHALELVVSNKSNLWVFIILCIVQIYLIVSGKVALGGVQTADIDSYRVSPLALLVTPLSYACMLVGGYMMYDLSRGLLRRYFFRFVFGTQFFYLLLGGRRLVAIALILAFFGLCISRVSRIRIWFVCGLFIVFFASSFCLFYALRVAGYSDEFRGAGRFERVRGQVSRLDVALTDRNSELSFADSLRENVSTRPFIIGYFAMLCKGEGSGALGRVLKVSLAKVVPSFFWNGKDVVLSEGDEEMIAYVSYGLPRLTDEANTIITSGYTELKIIGPFVYIFLAFTIIGVGCWLVIRVGSAECTVVVVASFFVLCLNLEGMYSAWFSSSRDVVICCLLLVLFGKFFGSRRHNEFARKRVLNASNRALSLLGNK